MSQAPAPTVTSAYQLRTLADWCSAHGEPYGVLDPGDEHLVPYMEGDTQRYIGRSSLFCGRVSNAVLVPRRGFILTHDNACIYDGLSYRNHAPVKDLGPFCVDKTDAGELNIRLPAEIPVVDQECIFFGGLTNFGHFMMECMARLAIIERIPGAETLPLAVYRGLSKNFSEFLDLAGWPESRRILIEDERPTRFAKVWHTSAPMRRIGLPWVDGKINWSPQCVHTIHREVRESVLARRPLDTSRRPALFALRNGAKWRRLLNQDEAMACLQRFGGEGVDFGVLSAEEQVWQIANARLLIVPVGAGSALTIFAPPDCAILEIMTTAVISFFGPMAYATCLGQPHTRLYGEIATDEQVHAAGLEIVTDLKSDKDYVIDCAAFEQYLRQTLT